MSRIEDDIRKIDQIIRDNYTGKKGKAAFVVLAEGGELSAIRVGDRIALLSAAAQQLAEVIAEAGKEWDVVQIVHRSMVAAMEKKEKELWQEKHGQAAPAGKELTPEEQLAARIKGDATA